MSRPAFIVCVFALTLILTALSGCTTTASNYNPSLYISSGGGGQHESKLTPTGSGWAPGSRLEISVYGEPVKSGNELTTTDTWRSVGFVNVLPTGEFGLNSGAFYELVTRTIPGAPPTWLGHPLWLARDTDTGLVRTHKGTNDFWFTYR